MAASPFPGMDPYLERHWRDVHATLVPAIKGQLNRVLPDDLVARAEERVVIDPGPDRRAAGRAVYPDVRVYEDRVPDGAGAAGTSTAADGSVAVATPIILSLEVERHTEGYVKVFKADREELVTVIEVVGPTNKRAGPDRAEYLRKRRKLFGSHVNVVEIDLLRRGRWRDLLRPLVAPDAAESAYRVTCWREHPIRRVELYPISLRQRLPVVPVPLRAMDEDVRLDLQPLVGAAYADGRYARLRYGEPCRPPLVGDDAVWADGLLTAAGRR